MSIHGKFFKMVTAPALSLALLASSSEAFADSYKKPAQPEINVIQNNKPTSITNIAAQNKYTGPIDKSTNISPNAMGGNASGQTNSQTVNGGNTNIDARGGAMPFSAIGSLYVPQQCMKGLGVNLTGGAVFVGGGGIGLQFIDPAGVPLRGGLTLHDYLKLEPKDRATATENFSNTQLSSLNCISYIAEQESMQRQQQQAMQGASLSSQEKIERWKISYNIIKQGMERYCAYEGKSKPFGATKEEHDKFCHVPFERALDELYPPKEAAAPVSSNKLARDEVKSFPSP